MFYHNCWIIALALLLGGTLSAQTTIKGTVTGPEGEPLVGANISLQPSKRGAATDQQGQFSIREVAPGSYTLKASYIGYQSQEQPVEVREGDAVLAVDFQLP
ncbi:MAG TPA: carboxypeptidase-like regulatory domain-containing protein, partial [Phaeodactylibacter sp.]|nr:carboxypeptidase-like regulatory domain-containing protein [Phaeodactylibacter sp.]